MRERERERERRNERKKLSEGKREIARKIRWAVGR